MKKAALELSINFFVGIVLGLVMFSFGMVLLFKILDQGPRIQEGLLPDRFDTLAADCVNRAERVCAPENTKTISSNTLQSYGVVILNLAGEQKTFKLFPSSAGGRLKAGGDVSAASIVMSEWTFTDFKTKTLENNEDIIIEVPIKVPKGTKAGRYLFNLNICYDDSNPTTSSSKCGGSYPDIYGTTQQITVVVP